MTTITKYNINLIENQGEMVMFVSDITDYGYEAGHFKIGQSVYHIQDKKHDFRFRKSCKYCESSGYIELKGKEFKCPNCNAEYYYKRVIEKSVDEEQIKIKSVLSFKNKEENLEIYTNDKTGYGLIIRKQDDGIDTYFGSKEEAQAACDKYNQENSVHPLLNEYRLRGLKENIYI